jgi:hypothetical protein
VVVPVRRAVFGSEDGAEDGAPVRHPTDDLSPDPPPTAEQRLVSVRWGGTTDLQSADDLGSATPLTWGEINPCDGGRDDLAPSVCVAVMASQVEMLGR